ncbi:DNA-processing protein DprA [Fulvimarina sp. 2208YS6-2-32]|uniref:DNA-processing protein DprA n=1 Tax=Fulvimarina uroteuthidis TaxID=3098149 RepID=A0ABU5I4B5_9HYPH|nr:DNA-processing protein DprA [Fulvimarina sp. 2208YS6-2-32]MDY8109773.1 DNA-processing protein DprA [Fulvimarina sp. 2208YS6-2-32]
MNVAGGRKKGVPFSRDMQIAWLRLFRSDNVGPVTFRQLINRYGGADAALDALPGLAERGGRRIEVADRGSIEREFERATKMGAVFSCLGEPDFPQMLAQDAHAPPVIARMGDPALFARPAVAVVGARNASLSGIKLTKRFSADLGQAGYVIVSGFARGIDAAAHEASLPTGTIGVFAGGLDKPYPPENKPLMRRVVDEGGCIVSARPFGWEPRAKDFPRRNRIVATLCHGLLVVEAAQRSGSLISARVANEIGRLVFAVPGSPLDPRAGGSNQLLKDGAILVTQTSDIIEALRPLDHRIRALGQDDLDEAEGGMIDMSDEPAEDERARIQETLGPTPVFIDDIVQHTGASPGAVQLVIIELELAGRLERHGDGSVSLLL